MSRKNKRRPTTKKQRETRMYNEDVNEALADAYKELLTVSILYGNVTDDDYKRVSKECIERLKKIETKKGSPDLIRTTLSF